jgi:hypothetical protein
MVAFSRRMGLGLALLVTGLVGCGSDSEIVDDGSDDASGGSGGTGLLTCPEGIAGVWAAMGFPAYLDIDSECRVTMFCDIPNDYHTTGYVDGNLLVLIDLAMKVITVDGDTLTILDASGDIDLPFVRQTSADAIPAECRN